MAWSLYRHNFSVALPAASLILPLQPVRLAGTSAIHVLPIVDATVRPFGVNGLPTVGASGLNQNEAITVFEEGCYVKARAAASLGAGVDVGVASTNGALTPAAAASGSWAVGVSMSPAAAGEVFTLYVKPRKVS